MPVEIERKFLVHHDKWELAEKPAGKFLRQGYLVLEPDKTIRVRLTDEKSFLTIKGISKGASRPEYEYEIPNEEAKELLDNFSVSELSKTRYEVLFKGRLWEVDVFFGSNGGLIIAEVELESEDEIIELPEWASTEVTGDLKYYNSNLTVMPFKSWNI